MAARGFGNDDDSLLAHVADCQGCITALTDAVRAQTRVDAEVLDRYVLVKELGRGGYGVVYEAYDPELDRRVALKQTAIGEALLPIEAVPNMIREAQAMARVDHDRVVKVYDTGRSTNAVYIAMQLVPGQSLEEALRSGMSRKFSVLQPLFSQICDGLAAIHDAGTVHRDVKPANIIISGDKAYISDFGLARLNTEEHVRMHPDGAMPTPQSDFTVTSEFVGTPRYAAPEVLAGESAGVLSDQYSLALSMYSALVENEPGEKAETLAALQTLRGRRPNREALLRVGVPRRSANAIVRAMEPAPQARFESAAAFGKAFGRRKDWLPVVAGAMCLAAALVVFTWLFLDKGTGAPALAECRSASADFLKFWDRPMRSRLETHLSQSEEVAAQWPAVSGRIDGLQADGRTLHRDSCNASRDGRGSHRDHRTLTTCLDGVSLLVENYVNHLFATTKDELGPGPVASIRLISLSSCQDGSFRSRFLGIVDEEERTQLVEYYRVLDQVSHATYYARDDYAKSLRDKFAATSPRRAWLDAVDAYFVTSAQDVEILAKRIVEDPDETIDPWTRTVAWGHLTGTLLDGDRQDSAQVALAAWEKAIVEVGSPGSLVAWFKTEKSRIARSGGDPAMGRALLEQALEIYQRADTRVGISRVRKELINLALSSNDFDEAEKRLKLAEEEILRWFGKKSWRYLRLLGAKSLILRFHGRQDEVFALTREGLILARRLRQPAVIFPALCRHATSLAGFDRDVEAMSLYEEALAIEGVGALWRAWCGHPYAASLIAVGRVDDAIAFLEPQLSLIRQSSQQYMSSGLVVLAEAYEAKRQHDRSIALLHEAIALANAKSFVLGVSRVKQYLGAYLVERRRYNEARAVLRGALEVGRSNRMRRYATALLAWSIVEQRDGHREAARDAFRRAQVAIGNQCDKKRYRCRRWHTLLRRVKR